MNSYNPNRDKNPVFMWFNKPDYYDSPEGKNPFEKIWGINKYAIPTALFFGITDSLYYTQARNAVETANCLGHWMVPLVGLSTAFASVTYMATNIRGKDDKINYACGVLACAPVLHAWKNSTSFTCWGIGILMTVALIKKEAIQNNFIFFPRPTHEFGNYNYDFSLVKEEWPRRPI